MSIKVVVSNKRINFPIVTQINGENRYYTPAAAKELRDKINEAIEIHSKLMDIKIGKSEVSK